MEPKPSDARLETRDNVFVKARCRTSRWHVADAALSDISAKGCCITTRTGLQVGQAVEVRNGSSKGLGGTVRWVRDLQAGIEFDKPLGEDQLAQLLSEHRVSNQRVARLGPKE